MPLFFPNQQDWQEDEDLKLLQFVVDLDLVGSSNQQTIIQQATGIPFSDLKHAIKTKTAEQCKQRWFVLLKGLGDLKHGQRVEPSAEAEKIIDQIKSRSDRKYAGTQDQGGIQLDSKGKQIIKEGNHFIDIVRYFNYKFKS